MPKTVFSYTDPKTLNKLVMLVSGERCELSASLMPEIPEFIESARKARSFHVSSPSFPGLDERLRKEQLTHDEAHAIVMLELCEKHNIMPFWKLRFDYSFRQFNEPDIRYIGYNFGGSVNDEPYKTCVDPVHFTKGSKWYSIGFNELKGQENIDRAKLAIAAFVEQGYIVVDINAELDPWVRSGEYADYKESKATMWASDGTIEFWGDVPDIFRDFDANKMPQPALPQPRKLLEGVVDTILKKKKE
jgi:hypothetical protein